jgi:nucleoside phosphorylase
MLVLIVPTRWETEAVLSALSAAVPEPAWDVPAWRAGDVLMLEPGMGPELAAALLPHLEVLEPQAVWLYGWCGGLTPDLGVGDLVLADATIFAGEDGLATRISHPAPDALVDEVRRLAHELGRRMVVGPALTSDQVLGSVEQKQAGAASGAVAVEMEAGPLARWATGRSLPFVHVRVVLDPLESALPSTDLPTDDHGYAQTRALLSHALTHPGEWPALWRLFRQIRTARRVMTDAIAALARPGGALGPKT